MPVTSLVTEDMKKASEKKSNEPTKTTRASFLAWRPVMSCVFLPTVVGYSETGFAGEYEYDVDEP